MRNYFRQLKYPSEFRIDPAKLSEEDIEGLYGLLNELPNALNKEGSRINEDTEVQDNSKQLLQLVADLATVFWRMQQKIDQLKSADKIEDDNYRRFLRYYNNAQDILRNNDFEISDHTNESHTGGEAYKVVAYQPEEDFTEEKVIETIKPTIYFKDKISQRGEVIVGQPGES